MSRGAAVEASAPAACGAATESMRPAPGSDCLHSHPLLDLRGPEARRRDRHRARAVLEGDRGWLAMENEADSVADKISG